MKSLRSFRSCGVLLLALAALAPAVRAQGSLASQLPLPPATAPAREGLIGQSYYLFDFSTVEDRLGNGRTFGPAIGANFAVHENADVTSTLTYAKQRDWPDNGNLFVFNLDWTAHAKFGQAQPFLIAGVGYQFSRTPSGTDMALWNLGAGVEVMIAPRTSATLRALNAGSFTKGVDNDWQYSLALNYWLEKNTALTGSVTRVAQRATGYSLGLRWGF